MYNDLMHKEVWIQHCNNVEALTRNIPRPAVEFWRGRGMRYCSRSGGGLIGAGGTAVTELGVSVARDRLIIPSVAALSAPANQQASDLFVKSYN